jgi:CDP-6-deoxy-D-xylo-4-hexulose-3-dehydrase
MDLGALEAAITDQTRAIMAVNILGNPNDFAAIERIISGRGIVLMEDNCESMGATLGNRKTGTFGVMGAQSAFFSHHISTMEGGMITTDDEELSHILLSLRSHGWTRHLPKENRVTGTKSDNPFEESFRFVLPGYNLRPLEISGAIGIEQVKKLPSLIADRRTNGKHFQRVMDNHPDILIQRETGASSWFGFSLIVRPGSSLTRERLLAKLTELGFECRPIIAGNFAKSESTRYLDFSIAAPLRNADYLDASGLFIGNHHYPIPEAIDLLATL